MRTLPWILLLLLLASGCSPTLNDDDDAVSDDDDATSDDDDATGDDDDATADDDDDDTPPPYVPGVVFSGWFGECAGECRRDMSIGESDTRVAYVTSDWENTIYVERAGILSAAGVEILAAALQTVDDVEASYGCPGCDDGGVRQITWDFGPVAMSTQYEWGDPPPLLLELVDVLSAIEAEIETCIYGDFFDSIPDCDPVPG